MHRKRLTMVLVVFAASAVGLSLLAGPVSAKVTARSAVRPTVITVTAGKPTELAFKLSKSSSIAVGPVTFKVTNMGALSHDFKICTVAVKTAAKTAANRCTGKMTPMLAHGKTATLTVTIAKAGQNEYLCTVAGHASAGMKGLIGVGAKAATPTPTPTGTPVPAGTPIVPQNNNGANGPPPATETLVGDPVAGAAIWTAAGCASCHTLKAAGATGQIGPNLDQTADGQSLIVSNVTNGINIMPAYGSKYSSTDINNVAAYVYSSTHTT